MHRPFCCFVALVRNRVSKEIDSTARQGWCATCRDGYPDPSVLRPIANLWRYGRGVHRTSAGSDAFDGGHSQNAPTGGGPCGRDELPPVAGLREAPLLQWGQGYFIGVPKRKTCDSVILKHRYTICKPILPLLPPYRGGEPRGFAEGFGKIAGITKAAQFADVRH